MTTDGDDWIPVLRDGGGLLHIPDPDDPSNAICGYDRPLRPYLHATECAAVWCSPCLHTAATFRPTRPPTQPTPPPGETEER